VRPKALKASSLPLYRNTPGPISALASCIVKGGTASLTHWFVDGT
jgi:hypothetical protein